MTNLINQAVCKSKEDDTVVNFLNESDMKPKIVEAIENNQIWGVYYNEQGEIVADDICGEVHADILN